MTTKNMTLDGLKERTAIALKLKPVIEDIINVSNENGLALRDMVVLVASHDMRDRCGPDLPALEEGDYYIMPGSLDGFKEYMDTHFPAKGDPYSALRIRAREGFVYVVVLTQDGVTITAMGSFIVSNVRTPNSPNN